MKIKPKPLCGLKKVVIKEHFVEVQRIVANPKFICGKCARVAHESAFLCKPKRLTS